MGIKAAWKALWQGKRKDITAEAMDSSMGRSVRFYGQKFSEGLPDPAPNLSIDHRETRLQVRVLAHNSMQLRALLERNTDTVIAQGLNLSPEPKHALLGISPEASEEWTSEVRQRFEIWSQDNRASRSGRYNFFQGQRLMEKCLYRDGELFVVLSYHSDSSLLSPLRFEVLDPEQIREAGFTFTGGNIYAPFNKEGITRNADGEESSYKVWVTGSNGIPEETVIPRVGRSGRIMMLHAFTETDYAGQLRGISPFAICIQELEQILNYTLAEVNKSINQSNIPFTVESGDENPADDPFKKVLPVPGSGPAAKQYGSAPSPDPNAKNVTEESIAPFYVEVPNTNFNKPGSMGVFSLKGNQKLIPFSHSAPSAQYNVFVDEVFKYIAAAMGQSIETVLMQFNDNYSASRATLILMWRIAEQRRWELDYYVLGPVYEMWLSEEIASGRISCPGFSDPRLRAAWTAHRYQGLAMPIINPSDFMDSSKKAVELGAVAIEEVAQEYNDSDYETNCIKNNEAFKNHPPPPWGFVRERNSASATEEAPKEKQKGGV